MNTAAAYALASLVCAGLTDVVHKRYSGVARSRGLYVLGIGVTWTLLQSAIVWAMGEGLRLDAPTIAFGLAAGVLVAASNILLIESLTHIDVGLGSTIYRLNTVAVVVMAVFVLGESLTGVKLAGVLLGITAVILLFERVHPHVQARRTFLLFFGLVVLASLLRACFGILSKLAAQHDVNLMAMLLFNAPVWIVMGGIYALWRKERIRVTRATLMYSATSGALICGVASFLMLAVARGEASVVVPIANMSFLVSLLISAGLRMERLTPRKLAAVGLAVAAIAVLAQA